MTGDAACIFIDAENINPYCFYKIIEKTKEFACIKKVKAFADWDSCHPIINLWNKVAKKNDYIEKISYPHIGRKNTSDILLTIHATEMLNRYKNKFEVFVLCSADSDFSPLITHMKNRGKLTIGFGGSNCSSLYQERFDYYFDVTPKSDVDVKYCKALFSLGEGDLNSPQCLGAINLIREAVSVCEKPNNTLVSLSDIGLFLKSNYHLGIHDLEFSGSLSDLIVLYPDIFNITSDYKKCSLIR